MPPEAAPTRPDQKVESMVSANSVILDSSARDEALRFIQVSACLHLCLIALSAEQR